MDGEGLRWVRRGAEGAAGHWRGPSRAGTGLLGGDEVFGKGLDLAAGEGGAEAAAARRGNCLRKKSIRNNWEAGGDGGYGTGCCFDSTGWE